MSYKGTLSAITTTLFLYAVNLSGFGFEGHRIVGHVAEHYLTQEARTAIKDLLGSESLARRIDMGR